LAVLLIIIGILVLLFLVALFIYNRTISRRNAVDNSWAQIETALQRRHDLIPNLVESVKGYAKHEQSTFEDVTKARGAAQAANTPQAAAPAEGILGAMIGRLMVVAEQYPALRATENFQQLQAQLSETEDQIQITRRVYNDTVQTYNTAIQVFPANLVANAANFEKREFFDAPAGSEATPEVSFGGDAAPKAEAPARK
jgi:LemA protein